MKTNKISKFDDCGANLGKGLFIFFSTVLIITCGIFIFFCRSQYVLWDDVNTFSICPIIIVLLLIECIISTHKRLQPKTTKGLFQKSLIVNLILSGLGLAALNCVPLFFSCKWVTYPDYVIALFQLMFFLGMFFLLSLLDFVDFSVKSNLK